MEKYTSFSINNRLSFIDNFQFLSSSLDSLVKNLDKNDLKYLSQEFDNNVLIIICQKRFYTYEYMTNFKELKSNYQAKKISLTGEKLITKNMIMFLRFGNLRSDVLL